MKFSDTMKKKKKPFRGTGAAVDGPTELTERLFHPNLHPLAPQAPSSP